MNTKYPVDIILKDKTRLICRPAIEKDIKKLRKFYQDLPEDDLLVYKDDMDVSKNPEDLILDINNKKIRHLVTLSGKKIIAHSTLRMEGMYWQNAAEIKLFVEQKYRNKGLGSQVFNLMLQEGFKSGIVKLIIRYTPDNKSLTKIIEKYGFSAETVLNQYIEDKKTRIHKDLIVGSLNLQDWKNKFEFYFSFFEFLK